LQQFLVKGSYFIVILVYKKRCGVATAIPNGESKKQVKSIFHKYFATFIAGVKKF
jgi:hypothetical protein